MGLFITRNIIQAGAPAEQPAAQPAAAQARRTKSKKGRSRVISNNNNPAAVQPPIQAAAAQVQAVAAVAQAPQNNESYFGWFSRRVGEITGQVSDAVTGKLVDMIVEDDEPPAPAVPAESWTDYGRRTAANFTQATLAAAQEDQNGEGDFVYIARRVGEVSVQASEAVLNAAAQVSDAATSKVAEMIVEEDEPSEELSWATHKAINWGLSRICTEERREELRVWLGSSEIDQISNGIANLLKPHLKMLTEDQRNQIVTVMMHSLAKKSLKDGKTSLADMILTLTNLIKKHAPQIKEKASQIASRHDLDRNAYDILNPMARELMDVLLPPKEELLPLRRVLGPVYRYAFGTQLAADDGLIEFIAKKVANKDTLKFVLNTVEAFDNTANREGLAKDGVSILEKMDAAAEPSVTYIQKRLAMHHQTISDELFTQFGFKGQQLKIWWDSQVESMIKQKDGSGTELLTYASHIARQTLTNVFLKMGGERRLVREKAVELALDIVEFGAVNEAKLWNLDPSEKIDIKVNAGDEQISIQLSKLLTDNINSQKDKLTISDIPVGATLTDGVNSFKANELNGNSVNVIGWNLAQLTITLSEKKDFSLAAQRVSDNSALFKPLADLLIQKLYLNQGDTLPFPEALRPLLVKLIEEQLPQILALSFGKGVLPEIKQMAVTPHAFDDIEPSNNEFSKQAGKFAGHFLFKVFLPSSDGNHTASKGIAEAVVENAEYGPFVPHDQRFWSKALFKMTDTKDSKHVAALQRWTQMYVEHSTQSIVQTVLDRIVKADSNPEFNLKFKESAVALLGTYINERKDVPVVSKEERKVLLKKISHLLRDVIGLNPSEFPLPLQLQDSLWDSWIPQALDECLVKFCNPKYLKQKLASTIKNIKISEAEIQEVVRVHPPTPELEAACQQILKDIALFVELPLAKQAVQLGIRDTSAYQVVITLLYGVLGRQFMDQLHNWDLSTIVKTALDSAITSGALRTDAPQVEEEELDLAEEITKKVDEALGARIDTFIKKIRDSITNFVNRWFGWLGPAVNTLLKIVQIALNIVLAPVIWVLQLAKLIAFWFIQRKLRFGLDKMEKTFDVSLAHRMIEDLKIKLALYEGAPVA